MWDSLSHLDNLLVLAIAGLLHDNFKFCWIFVKRNWADEGHTYKTVKFI